MFQMKSQHLMSMHSWVYEHFFTTHDLVVSLPHTFRRWHSISRWNTSFSIKQKTSAKMYCAVNTSYTTGVTINTILCYDQLKNTFVSHLPDQLIRSTRLDALKNVIVDLLQEYGYTWWFSCSILSEYWKWFWFWFTAWCSTLLAMTILILTHRIKSNELDTIAVQKKIITLSLYIEIISGWCPSGITPYAQTIKTILPIVQLGCVTVKKQWEHIALSEQEWRVFPFQQLFPTIKEHDWSCGIDYGIISCGIAYNAQSVMQHYNWFINNYVDSIAFIRKLTAEYNLGEQSILHGWLDIREVSNCVYADILKHMSDLCSEPMKTQAVESLLQSIADSGMYSAFIEKTHVNLQDLYHVFQQAKLLNDERIAFTPISSGKRGGSFLFVCRHDQSRYTLERMEHMLKHAWYPWLHLPYLSRRDGFCNDGLQIHQYLSQKQYSRFVGPGYVQLISWTGQIIIGSHNEILLKEISGIILDKVYSKVYIQWQKITHKELVSQSATTEIITKLIQNKWNYVHSSEFPVSSYSKNKNEMLGKIVVPFMNLMKNMFSAQVHIDCIGGMYDFQVKIHDHDLHHIHIITSLYIT